MQLYIRTLKFHLSKIKSFLAHLQRPMSLDDVALSHFYNVHCWFILYGAALDRKQSQQLPDETRKYRLAFASKHTALLPPLLEYQALLL